LVKTERIEHSGVDAASRSIYVKSASLGIDKTDPEGILASVAAEEQYIAATVLLT
jgi:hypothetical protein